MLPRSLSIIFIILAIQSSHAYLMGPIVDAYQQPFLYVYGTLSPNSFENDEIRRTAQDVVDKWKINRGRDVPIKKDVEVTDEDIKNYHLILYGNERSNKILQKVAKDMPIRFTEDSIIVGDHKYTNWDEGAIFVAPNPLNPNKYVLIYGAIDYHGFPHINAVEASFTDYAIFNNKSKNLLVGDPHTGPIEEGYFDKSDPMHWKVKPTIKTPTHVAEETSYQPVKPVTPEKKVVPTQKKKQ